VGLFGDAEYTAGVTTLHPGWRVILVSDGFTEAENEQGEFFGEERLDSAVVCSDLQRVLGNMVTYCAGHPASDDCTIVQVSYSGHPNS